MKNTPLAKPNLNIVNEVIHFINLFEGIKLI